LKSSKKPFTSKTEITVVIDKPLSSNNANAIDFKTGRRFLTLEAKQFAGEKRKMLKRGKINDKTWPEMTLKEGVNYRVLPRGKIYVFGRFYYLLKDAGVPKFVEGMKIVVKAWAVWPGDGKRRDMSNLQKLAEDVFQKGGFLPNDDHLLWRNMNFRVSSTWEHYLKLKIYILKEGEDEEER